MDLEFRRLLAALESVMKHAYGTGDLWTFLEPRLTVTEARQAMQCGHFDDEGKQVIDERVQSLQ